jgi:hypothetical protein
MHEKNLSFEIGIWALGFVDLAKCAIMLYGSLTYHCFVKGLFKIWTNQKMGYKGISTKTRFEGD